MDKKAWDQAYTIQSNNAQARKQKIAGSPILKTQALADATNKKAVNKPSANRT